METPCVGCYNLAMPSALNAPRSNRDLQEALARLPHGSAFRFIDRLLELRAGQSGVGEYLVRGDEPFLSGDSGQAILPGVLLVEAGTQLAGTVAQADPHHSPLAGLKLTALRNVKILGPARRGDVIRLEAKITARLANLVQLQTVASINGQVVMQGQVTLSGDP